MRVREIIKKVGLCAAFISILGTELLSKGIGFENVYAAETTTREKIESSYTETTAMTPANWKDSLQKNYQVSGTTDSYLIKSVEWTDIEKGEGLITLAAQDTVEEYSSYAVYLFTTCSGHTEKSHNANGLSPERVIHNVQYLLQTYDAVDCVLVDGNYDWQTCYDSGLDTANATASDNGLYEQGTSVVVMGSYKNINSRTLVKKASSSGTSLAEGLNNRYIGINPVHTFYKKDNPTESDIGTWLDTMPWVSGAHITQSLPAALRAYLFGGDKLMDDYGSNAQAFTKNLTDGTTTAADAYRGYLRDAWSTEIKTENLKKRPTAIYIAGDSYVTHPRYASWTDGKQQFGSQNFSTSYLFEESANKDFAKFLKNYYVGDSDATKRYFSFSSQSAHPQEVGAWNSLQAHGTGGTDVSKNEVRKSLTAIQCMFQPAIWADSSNAYESPCVGQNYTGTMITARMADYPYSVDFRDLTFTPPPKSITIEDTIEDYFDVVNTADITVTTLKNPATTGSTVGTPVSTTFSDGGKDYQRISVTVDNYTAGDELTVKIPVKLNKTNYDTWLAAHSSDDKLVSNHGDATLYDGSMSIRTVNPNLALPAAQDVFKKIRTVTPTFTKKLTDEALDSTKGFTFSIVEATDETCATKKATNSTGIKMSDNEDVGLGSVSAAANVESAKVSLGSISVDATKDSDDGTDIGLTPGSSKSFYFKVYETIGSSAYEQTSPAGNYYKLKLQVDKAADSSVTAKWYLATKDQAFSAVAPVNVTTNASPNFAFVNKTKAIDVKLEATNGTNNGTVRNSDSTPMVIDQSTNPFIGHVNVAYNATQTIKYKGNPGYLLDSVQIDGGAVTRDFTTSPGTTYKTGSYDFTSVTADRTLKVAYVKPTVSKTASVDSADISIASGKNAKVGDTVKYEIKANNPTGMSRDVNVEDILDADLEFVSASAGGTYDAGTRKISWPTASIAAGGNETFSFEAKILASGDGKTISNKANVKYVSIGAAEDGDNIPADPEVKIHVGDPPAGGGGDKPKKDSKKDHSSGSSSSPVIVENTNYVVPPVAGIPLTPPGESGSKASKAPKTGDETGIYMWLALLAMALGGAGAWTYYAKNKGIKSENEQEK